MFDKILKSIPGWGWVIGSCLMVVLAQGVVPELSSVASAQSANPNSMATQVYERLPDFPREDQYPERGRSTLSDSTLISRLIQYHTFVKGRLPIYRLDWQVTFADYLGLNDYILEETYPGQGFLRTNPMAADIEAVQQLSRTQRRAVVQALVDVFTGRSAPVDTPPPGAALPSPRVETVPAPYAPVLPPLSPPGSVDLLLPPRPQSPARPQPGGDAQHLLLD